MRALYLLPILATACSPQVASNTTTASTEVNISADRATTADVSINNAAAAPAPLTPAEPGQPGGLADDKTPTSEAPFTPDSPQGAANVVQTYYALIGEGKYAEAWKLWGNDGKASGQPTADAFAASFGKYSEYRANIGAPGREDAGAGQRYVTVPVQPYARLKDGKAAYWIGSVVLHRTVMDGAPASEKAWQIQSIDLKPAPPAAAK